MTWRLGGTHARLLAASLAVGMALVAACSEARPSRASPTPPASEAPPARDGWSAVPLPPDPAFEAAARNQCLTDFGADASIPLLIQDRRRVDLAALYFESPAEVVDLLVRRNGDGTFRCESGGGGSPPFVRGVALAVTSWTNIGDETSDAWLISGHVDPRATRVVLRLADGLAIEASVGSGRFVAWWETPRELVLVAALDGNGSEIARVDDPLELGGAFPNP